MRVSVDSTHYAFTDKDGTYVISRLAAGSYTVKAVLDGYSFTAPFFNNPIDVGPNFTTADFVASWAHFKFTHPSWPEVRYGNTWTTELTRAPPGEP